MENFSKDTDDKNVNVKQLHKVPPSLSKDGYHMVAINK